VLLAGAIEVNALAQGALRQFTQWLWIEHPTFQLGGGHFTTELMPLQVNCSWMFSVIKSSIMNNFTMVQGRRKILKGKNCFSIIEDITCFHRKCKESPWRSRTGNLSSSVFHFFKIQLPRGSPVAGCSLTLCPGLRIKTRTRNFI